MADIAKCKNEECPSKLNCIRYIIPASYIQTYGSFKVPEGEDKCEYYWPNEE